MNPLVTILIVAIFLLFGLAGAYYSITANYRLKQLNCVTDASPLMTAVNQWFHSATFGLFGFIAGRPYRDRRFARYDTGDYGEYETR